MLCRDRLGTAHQGEVARLVELAFYVVGQRIVVREAPPLRIISQHDLHFAGQGERGTLARAEGVVVAPALAIDEPDHAIPGNAKLQPVSQAAPQRGPTIEDRPMRVWVGAGADFVSKEQRPVRSLADAALF